MEDSVRSRLYECVDSGDIQEKNNVNDRGHGRVLRLLCLRAARRPRTQRHGSYSGFVVAITSLTVTDALRQSSLATSVGKDRLQGRRADLSSAAW